METSAILRALSRVDSAPDVVSLSGWHGTEGGYFGTGKGALRKGTMLGKTTDYYSCSHERAHISCAFGLSPFAQGQQFYALIWEGTIGSFYHVSADFTITRLPEVLTSPGLRYAYLYFLGANTEPAPFSWMRHHEMPGKLMALAGYGRRGEISPADVRLVEHLLAVVNGDTDTLMHLLPKQKNNFPILSEFADIGVETQRFKNVALALSDGLFRVFCGYAKKNLLRNLPLVIGGGCGLNCEWNEKWRQSGLFSDVFIPPCANDSGIAIGAAIDAQHYITGEAKIEWSVYCGGEWNDDLSCAPGWTMSALVIPDIAQRIAGGEVVFWAQGRWEVGPRALGNRSILAAPFSKETLRTLNQIKQREQYRPIAPVCAEEDMQLHFRGKSPSSHMLYFHQVVDPRLQAITHVDGSARVQTVSATENRPLHQLLGAFRQITGVAILCNTSLNRKGCGFLNRTSDALNFADQCGVKTVVVNETVWTRRQAA